MWSMVFVACLFRFFPFSFSFCNWFFLFHKIMCIFINSMRCMWFGPCTLYALFYLVGLNINLCSFHTILLLMQNFIYVLLLSRSFYLFWLPRNKFKKKTISFIEWHTLAYSIFVGSLIRARTAFEIWMRKTARTKQYLQTYL